jgi:hypothetical protein
MRRIVILLATFGCATIPPPASQDDAAGRPVILTGDRIIEGERPRASITALSVPPSTAWPLVKGAYQALGIDLNVDNPTMHQMGNSNFWRTRTVGPLRMSELVECGMGMTGRKADTYRIYMALLTMVNPDGKGGTSLQTTLTAAGQDMSGTSSDRIVCGSTGKLELTIHDMVKKSVRPY